MSPENVWKDAAIVGAMSADRVNLDGDETLKLL